MSSDQHNKIVQGIVFGILVQGGSTFEGKGGSSLAPEALVQDLSSIVRDHYSHAIDILNTLIDRCQDHLMESTYRQMQWLCEILISKNVPSVRFTFLALLRVNRPNFTDKKSVS